MSALFRKLNLKDQQDVLLLDAPPTLEPEVAALADVRVHRDPAARSSIPFALAFVQTLAQVEAAAAAIVPRAADDAVLWLAYPKQTSKRYRCDFNRDTGWAALGAAGYEPVRQVAIDEDWSALRFRRVEHIRTLTRAPARRLSAAGRARGGGSDGARSTGPDGAAGRGRAPRPSA